MALKKIEKNAQGVPTGEYTNVAGGILYADMGVGTITPFGGLDDKIPIGWLKCNGQAVSRTTYAELFAVIGTNFGVGDGSTTFNLPDMRESVPKGAGLTGHTVGAHLDADGLAVGEFLDDRLQDYFAGGGLPTYIGGESGIAELGGGNYSYYVGNQRRELTATRRGATTEVKSVGVNYIIKAKMIAVPADFMSAVDEAVEDVYGDIIPSDASASNKLVTAEITGGNNGAFLNTTPILTYLRSLPITIKIASFNVSPSYAEVTDKIDTVHWFQYICNRAGDSAQEWTIHATSLDGTLEYIGKIQSSTTEISWQKLVTESDIIVSANGDDSTALGTVISSTWRITSNGSLCVCYGINTEAFNANTTNMVSMQLPSGYIFDCVISANVFIDGNASWVTGASHTNGNGAGTYTTASGIVNPGSFRQIVFAHKA